MKKLTLMICGWLVLGQVCALRGEIVLVTTNNFAECRQMKSGTIYRFAESFEFAAAIGESAMTLTNGEAGILVPAGVTVTLKGGAARGMKGAGAGIEVAPGARLYVYGDGELVGVGGEAASGGSGLDGGTGGVELDEFGELLGSAVRFRSASGGGGGAGGGGAGAGLGGRGGDGGQGAFTTQPFVTSEEQKGPDGAAGTDGQDGAASGEAVIYGPKTFRGGAVAEMMPTGGAAGVVACKKSSMSCYFAAFGGGGGGAGANGGAAADIGGGGAGGGGGGAGGGGACRSMFTLSWLLSTDGWGRGGGGTPSGADNRGYHDPATGWTWDATTEAVDGYSYGVGGVAGANGVMGASGARISPDLGRTVNGESVWKGEGRGWTYDALRNTVVLQENGPYDIQGDVSVDGNGHYRVTFPGSPVVLWLADGEYVFKFAAVSGSRVVTRHFEVSVKGEDTVSTAIEPVDLGVSVNGESVGLLMGNGWTYSPISGLLTLDGSVPYVVSGYDGVGKVQVEIRGEADVTFSNLHLSGVGSNANIVRLADGAQVKLGLAGTNLLYSSFVNGAGLRLSGTSSVEIDSCDPAAMLVAGGGEETPGLVVEPEASLTLNGGLVYALAGIYGASGIGGDANGCGAITVTGGTIGLRECDGASCIGGGATVTGGSIQWVQDLMFAAEPTNALGQALHCVSVEVGGTGAVKVNVEGLENYGTKDIYAIGGKVCLWLPDGLYEFEVDGVDYFAEVAGGPAKAFARVGMVKANYLCWDGSGFVTKEKWAYPVSASTTALGGLDWDWYVVTGEVTTAGLGVSGTANLILADGAKLTANSGVRVNQGNTLNVYAQSEGGRMGALVANGASNTAGIGGGYNGNGGTIRIEGGSVTATGGKWAAGIGGGYNQGLGYGNGGTVSIFGGVVTATGGQYAAGIGGGDGGNGGTVTISGGLITATSGESASGIGGGNRYYNKGGAGGTIAISGGTVVAEGLVDGSDIGRDGGGGAAGQVTITGGSVYLAHGKATPQPTDAAGRAVYCVTVEVLEPLASVDGLDGYGLRDVVLTDGMLYLWLPDGEYAFAVNGIGFSATVNGANTTAVNKDLVGVTVNGRDVGWRTGEGWTYRPKSEGGDGSVELTGAGPYVLSGANTAGEVMFSVASDATVTLSNLCLKCMTPGASCLWTTNNATVALYLAGENTLDASANGEGLCLASGAHLTVAAAPGFENAAAVLVARGGNGCAAIAADFDEANPEAAPHFEIASGTVLATGGEGAADILAGRDGQGGRFTISGGSVVLTRLATVAPNPAPSNGTARVWCVTVGGLTPNAVVALAGLEGYGTNGLVADGDGKVCLWLPNGEYEFSVGGVRYGVSVGDANATVVRLAEATGVMVNGLMVDRVSGPGWAYHPKAFGGDGSIELTGAGPYALSGTNTTGEVMVSVAADAAVTLSNLCLRCTTKLGCCLVVANDTAATLCLAGTNTLDAYCGPNAHAGSGLIVRDNARLTVTNAPGFADADAVLVARGSDDHAAVAVARNGGTGSGPCLEIAGGTVCANWLDAVADHSVGIGSGYDTGLTGEALVVISGGFVFARGGFGEPGIGGASDAAAPTVRISGGHVESLGGQGAVGIGAGINASSCIVTVEGGTVRATGVDRSDMICSGSSTANHSFSIVGGSVVMTRLGKAAPRPSPKNANAQTVWCVTVGGLTPNAAVALVGLGGYGTKDIVADGDGKVFLWLPNGEHQFSVNGEMRSVTVRDANTDAYSLKTAFREWDGSGFVQNERWVIPLTKDIVEIGGDRWYVVRDKVEIDRLAVSGSAHLVLADAARLTVKRGVNVPMPCSLNVYAQSDGDDMGELVATGADYAAGIGSTGESLSAGTIVIHGGKVTATGGLGSAGIGGGTNGSVDYGSGGPGGTVTIHGGRVSATGGLNGAGIGGGCGADFGGAGGTVAVNGGRVSAKSGFFAAGIGGGFGVKGGGAGGTVTVNGGTVEVWGDEKDIGGVGDAGGGAVAFCGGNVVLKRLDTIAPSPAPTNANGQPVWCVTVEGFPEQDSQVRIAGLDGYGVRDIVPVNGKICLWLPDGKHEFAVDGVGYTATVAGGAATAKRTNTVAAATPEQIANSVRTMVANLDLAALTAAPVEAATQPAKFSASTASAPTEPSEQQAVETDGIDVTVSGGVPGCAYTLLAAGELEALGDGAPGGRALPDSGVKEYGPVVCGEDGTVTFRGVKRPNESRGFFTIRYER